MFSFLRAAAAILLAVHVSGCVSVAPNRLSAVETADLRFAGIEVKVPESAAVDWAAAEDAYLDGRGLSKTDPALARTPEARAHVNAMVAHRLKAALERATAQRAAGNRPVRLVATVKQVVVPSAARRIVMGGNPIVAADIDVVDARTGRVLTSYVGGVGVQGVGQGVTGVLIDAALTSAGMDELFDRAANTYARGFAAWISPT